MLLTIWPSTPCTIESHCQSVSDRPLLLLSLLSLVALLPLLSLLLPVLWSAVFRLLRECRFMFWWFVSVALENRTAPSSAVTRFLPCRYQLCQFWSHNSYYCWHRGLNFCGACLVLDSACSAGSEPYTRNPKQDTENPEPQTANPTP